MIRTAQKSFDPIIDFIHISAEKTCSHPFRTIDSTEDMARERIDDMPSELRGFFPRKAHLLCPIRGVSTFIQNQKAMRQKINFLLKRRRKFSKVILKFYNGRFNR